MTYRPNAAAQAAKSHPQWGQLVGHIERLARTAPPSAAERAAIAPSPEETRALLCAVATTASGFTEILASLRVHVPANGIDGPAADLVDLEQAIAAAHDLRVTAEHLANRIDSNSEPIKVPTPSPEPV